MPITKLQLRPGINRERTRYANEDGWFDGDKVRFRHGLPERIGGWQRLSSNTYLGVCRSMFNWTTLTSQNLLAVGTHLKYYIERGGVYFDVTPIRASHELTDPFATALDSTTVTVFDASHNAVTGSYVTFSGAVSVGGLDLDGEYRITVLNSDEYTIEAAAPALFNEVGGGTVTAAYQINVGAMVSTPVLGWGAGGYGFGPYGIGQQGTNALRLWSQSNFGQDLVFVPRNGPIFYWTAATGLAVRAARLDSLAGATDVPEKANYVLVSDVSRFVFAFGCNGAASAPFDPMRIRWSDQENAVMWQPGALNQAGELRLSKGNEIITAMQARQEILVWTDAALYSLQFVGAPIVWGSQLVGDNISIASPNARAYANGVAYWMGRGTFYRYDGTVNTLPCDVLRYVFNDFNYAQSEQVHAGTCARFNEVWWFYCSAGAATPDRYVIYNYVENIWYYGTLERTAWLDSPLRDNPMAATPYFNVVLHESGLDAAETATPTPVSAFIQSADFDLGDGDSFMLVNKILPDITFNGSIVPDPSVVMALLPQRGSGAGYNDPLSEGGVNERSVTRTATVPVQQYEDQVHVRVRGRQMSMRVSSDRTGVMWQLGSPRLDVRPSGRRG